MLKTEVNTLFRDLVTRITNRGFKITTIGKLIFGSNAYSQIQRFTKGLEIDKESHIEFGYSPLNKVGRLLNYDLHLVYVKRNDNIFAKLLYDKNNEFIEDLEVHIVNYLTNNIGEKNLLNEKERITKAVNQLLEML